MSLQVWLPFNGDLTNRGLDGSVQNISSTLPTFVEGKIGQCFKANTAYPEVTFENLKNISVYSFCAWIKIPSAETFSAWTDLFLIRTQHDDHTSSGIRIEHYSTAGAYAIYFNKSSSYGDNTSTSFSIKSAATEASDKWAHIAVTNSGSEIKLYINGVYQKTVMVSDIYASGHLTGGLKLGSDRCTGLLNDLRIYDHCLSAKEIKEISKGLVLHYPLHGEGGVNLLKGVATCTATSDETISSGSLIYDTSLVPLNSLIGKTFVFSFDYSVEGSKANATGNWQNDRFGAHLSLTYKDASGTIATTYPATGYLEHSGTGRAVQTYVCDFTWTEITGLSVVLQPYNKPASGNTNTWYIKNFKLELGNTDTGYSVNPNTLGVTPNKIIDCSGYGNDGSVSGFVASDKNTARYNSATAIEGVNNISIPNLTFENMANGSLSFWIKFNSFVENKWSHYVFLADAFNWTGQEKDFIIISNLSNTSTNICLDCCSYTSTYELNLNQWYHITIAWDAVNYKIYKYIDGSLVYTHDDSTNKRLDVYRSKHNTRGLGNITKNSSYSGDFAISDFRIYATTFSADDVKELYQIPIAIDKSGNVFGFEFIEDQKPEFKKTGIIENSYIYENETDDSDPLITFHVSKTKTSANQIYEV